MRYQFFISYNGPTRKWADELAAALRAKGASVFLAHDCIRPGQDWQKELLAAARESSAMVVLVSEQTGEGFQQEEILLGVELARTQPEQHRVCPVYLDRSPRTGGTVALGLLQKHALFLEDAGSVSRIAELLLGQPSAPEEDSLGARVVLLERLLLERERQSHLADSQRQQHQRIVELEQVIRRQLIFQAGDVVAGSRLERVIGGGNFGTIWLARRSVDDRYVATKIFDVNKLTQGVMLWRFRRSSKAISQLNRRRDAPSNIVRIHEVSEDELSFTMDYLPDGNLEGVARRGWTLERKVEVFLDICRAVEFAHGAGVIHRDIKPANIVMDDSGRPVLTDFDIADVRFATTLSLASGGLGTPVFAAPEQLVEAEDASERSDVYSLGRLLHYLLLERSPGLQSQDDPNLDRLSDSPAALVEIVRKSTQYSPADRFPDVKSLIRAVEVYETRWALAKARAAAACRWMRRNGWPISFGLLLILGLTWLAIYQTAAAHRERALRERVELASSDLARLQARFNDLQAQRDELSSERTRLELRRAAIERELQAPALTARERDEKERDRQDLGLRLAQVEARQRRIALEIAAAQQELEAAVAIVQGSSIPLPADENSGPTLPESRSSVVEESSQVVHGSVGIPLRIQLPRVAAGVGTWRLSEASNLPRGLAINGEEVAGVPQLANKSVIPLEALAAAGVLRARHTIDLEVGNQGCGGPTLARCGEDCIDLGSNPLHKGECFRVASDLVADGIPSAPPWSLAPSIPRRLYRLTYFWDVEERRVQVRAGEDRSGWSFGADETVGTVAELPGAFFGDKRHVLLVGELAMTCKGQVLAIDYNTRRWGGYEKLRTGDEWTRVRQRDWSPSPPSTPSARDLGLDIMLSSVLEHWKALCATQSIR
jgi:serine/threonine protein kinase